MKEKMLKESAVSLSPSFHNSTHLADVAARVVEEFKAEVDTENEFFVDEEGLDTFEDEENLNKTEDEKTVENENEKDEVENEDEDDDDDFEFSFVKESEFSPISADEIFYNGQIRPIYPIFNKDLLSNGYFIGYDENKSSNSTQLESNSNSNPRESIRLPLRKLFMEDRETNSSCSSASSSEADDLEGIPSGTYCVWRPKPPAVEPTASGCKKSNSTGSSKRWKFRDLLHRSNSEGKDTFVFLTPSFKKRKNSKTNAPEVSKVPEKSPAGENSPAMPYLKNAGGDKRKSYLPYRKDLVGFFANVNGLSRNLQPF